MTGRLGRGVVVFLFVVSIVAAAVPAAAVGNERFPQSVASGDPRADSIVLWTRVIDDLGLGTVVLELATDADFTTVVVTREVAVDSEALGVVKVRIDGLDPYTTYWYRFAYGTGALMETSPVGRTRTAPAADDPRTLRFAVLNCQDYNDRYYNSYLKLLRDHDEDIDFVVHLGDYVYETSGNPASDRRVEFDDVDGAIALGSGDSTHYAAKSLANYRTLYRTYRSDPMLQAVHERWPMIAIWDDHEFSDDCWGATATYFDGRVDEYEPQRRRNSERVYLEWMPIDVGLDADGNLAIDEAMLWPNNTIYRDFRFGSLLNLAMTDYRSYRPDHLVPEGAFPGAIAVDEPTLRQVLGDAGFDAVSANLDPYFDMDVLGAFLPILKQTCTLIVTQLVIQENPGIDTTAALAWARTLVTGNMSTTFVNSLFAAAGIQPFFVGDVVAGMPRGLSYLFVGKTALNNSLGSRYLLLKDGFDLFSGVRYAQTAGAAENAFGGAQFAWLAGALQDDAAWHVVASSVSMTPMYIDFTNPVIAAVLPPEFPDALRTRILIDADQWDGFPHARLELEGLLATVPNAVVISGDIHAWFVTQHPGGMVEFTAPAVSSESEAEEILDELSGHPVLGQLPGLEQLVAALGPMIQLTSTEPSVTSSQIADVNLNENGYLLVDVTADAVTSTMVTVDSSETPTSYYDDPEAVDELFSEHAFVVHDGMVTPAR